LVAAEVFYPNTGENRLSTAISGQTGTRNMAETA